MRTHNRKFTQAQTRTHVSRLFPLAIGKGSLGLGKSLHTSCMQLCSLLLADQQLRLPYIPDTACIGAKARRQSGKAVVQQMAAEGLHLMAPDTNTHGVLCCCQHIHIRCGHNLGALGTNHARESTNLMGLRTQRVQYLPQWHSGPHTLPKTTAPPQTRCTTSGTRGPLAVLQHARNSAGRSAVHYPELES